MLIFDQLRKSDRHLQLIAVMVLVGMGILMGGLWYLQVISAKRYQADVQGQSFRTVRVPAIRGKVLDRNRQPLADNRPCYNVNLYLEELRRNFRHQYTNSVKREFERAHPKMKLTRSITDELERQARYQVVSNLVVQTSSVIQEPRFLLEKEFLKHYDSSRSLPLPLLKDLSFQQVAMFAEKSPNLSSLALEPQPLRVYRYHTAAAHILGHLRRDDNPSEDEERDFQFRLPDYRGVKGIEVAFDTELRGKPGVKLVKVNSMQYRQSEEMLTPPEPGQNVILTIDLTIQQAAERALLLAGEETRGAAVVMNSENGDILAMASAPSFDPNEFMSPILTERWETFFQHEKLLPMLNRAVYGEYPPGSVFKIITGLACLEAGLDPDEVYRSAGFYRLSLRGRPIGDTAGAGDFKFRTAFCFSSNPYFQNFGLKAGPQKLVEMGVRFGLGERTGISNGMEAKGYFPKLDDIRKSSGNRWMDGDTANLCIGQGEIKVTPLQMAVVTAGVASGGKIWQPRLVSRIEPQESQSEIAAIDFPAGQVRRDLMLNPQHLALLRQAMLDDVEFRDPVTGRWGTGRSAAVKGMRVCGKTGTAQVVAKYDKHITWFVSFAPFEAPRYVVVVMVEGGASGGGTCAPIAKIIYEALLKREQQLSTMPQAFATPSRPPMTTASNQR